MHELKTLVSATATQVNTLEATARTLLHGEYNEETYRDIMHQKATILASLHDTCIPLLETLPESPQKDAIGEGLARFSQSASNALRLNSVFYMSALLFPEDYIAGTPNDLEIFIEQFLP